VVETINGLVRKNGGRINDKNPELQYKQNKIFGFGTEKGQIEN